MKISNWTILIPALFFIQQLPGFSSLGVDLPLIFAALVGLRTRPTRAAAWGFFMGFLQDLLSAGWVGPNTVAKTFTGILASLAQRHVYRERILTQGFLIFIASLFHQLCVWLILRWDSSAPLGADAFGICFRNVLATTLAGMLVCFFVVRFRRRRMDPATA